MSVLEKEQFDTLVQEVKAAILKESQGVGEVEVVNSLDDVYSLPALRGKSDVVEVPISLLSLPAEQASITANSAATKALSAAEFADNIAQHPTYIGEDNYVYQWNYELSVYEKTAIYVRGEGFSVSKVFSSITEMEQADMTQYKDGSFFLINTDNIENPDNAKLYVLKNGGPTFLVDMSGAIGFTGKTPQFKIGTVTIGTSRSDCTAAVSSNGEVDSDGNPIYLLNLKIPSIALSDLSSEEVSMLQSPAREMITELSNTNQEVQNDENLRISAEYERSNNESTRVSAEQARSSAELTRSNNESLRVDAEVDRNNSEQTRSDNEQSRISQEALRKESEEAREANEGQRISNESERLSAESMRAEEEDSRNTAESLRVSNEAYRIYAENERIAAEQQRASAESTRAEAENTRLSAEQQRQENENSRNEDYQTIRSGAISATESANSAATKASNLPYIQDNTWHVFDFSQGIYINSGVSATGQSPRIENGTWWVFSDTTGQYYNTGQSVNSDYVLTKEGVEDVLTGDITTHTHNHLRYVAQVYDVVPDLATLTSYTDELGEHNFLLGNDIYVADTSEPLGYALYKLGKTNDGQAWIRIPQVPEGYMMVLVKNG